MNKNININEIMKYIMEYRLNNSQIEKIKFSNNKQSLIYDMIMADIKQRFGIDFSENFEICYNVTEIADLCSMEVA